MNVGINTTDGCATMVMSKLLLLLLLCHQDMTPRRKPGRKMVAKIVVIIGRVFASEEPPINSNGEASASPLPTRERRQAA